MSSSQCECLTGYFDNGLPDCQSCEHECGSCVDIPSNCLSCSEQHRVNAPECICETGYFEDAQLLTCQPCAHQCADCENQADSCIACTGQFRGEAPLCQCQDGYYDDGVSADCVQCSVQCTACLNATHCLACKKIFF